MKLAAGKELIKLLNIRTGQFPLTVFLEVKEKVNIQYMSDESVVVDALDMTSCDLFEKLQKEYELPSCRELTLKIDSLAHPIEISLSGHLKCK